jgi:hypothetical protein
MRPYEKLYRDFEVCLPHAEYTYEGEIHNVFLRDFTSVEKILQTIGEHYMEERRKEEIEYEVVLHDITDRGTEAYSWLRKKGLKISSSSYIPPRLYCRFRREADAKTLADHYNERKEHDRK